MLYTPASYTAVNLIIAYKHARRQDVEARCLLLCGMVQRSNNNGLSYSKDGMNSDRWIGLYLYWHLYTVFSVSELLRFLNI